MKKTIRNVLMAAVLITLVLSALFPPYAVLKMEGDKIGKHGAVGRHPFWNPPTKEFAYAFLEKTPFVEDTAIGAENQLSPYRVMFNMVNFVATAILLIGMEGVLGLAFRRRKST